jgi:hypothetical protein
MSPPKALFEFKDGSRPSFSVEVGETILGHGPSCAVRIEAAGVADQHVRVIVDGAGGVWLENFEPSMFTLRNGDRVTARERLGDGDVIEIGLASLVFHAAAATAPAAKVGAQERTMIGSSMPPELKAFLAQREANKAAATAEQASAPKAPDPWESAPATVMQSQSPVADPWEHAPATVMDQQPRGAIVGKPEPEPPKGRTVEMAPSEAPKPAAAAAPKAAPPRARSTIMGFPPVQSPPKPGAPTPVKPSAPTIKPPQEALKTVAMEAPVLPKAPTPTPTPTVKPPQEALKTVAMEAPVLPKAPAPTPARAPASKPPQEAVKTMAMDAPILPPWPTVEPTPTPTPPPSLGATHYRTAPAEVQPPEPAVPAPPPAAPEPAPAYAPPTYAPPPAYAPPPMVVQPSSTYRPPASRGAFGSFSRAFGFVGQMFSLASQNRTLWKPVIYDLALTTPISIGLAILLGLVHSAGAAYALLAIGVGILYFVDYACNSLTASLIYDQVTTGQASVSNATPRVRRALGGIMVFAAASALLDVAATYARERRDLLSRILVNILRAIWTTATYVIMPALVLEGVSFGQAFSRSKKLMEHDPTGVGAGVVAMSLASYLVGVVVFPAAYFAWRLGSHVHPALGGVLFFLLINVYWSFSGWLKIAYSTCFYLWARQCEEQHSQDPALAPDPLRYALEAA